MPRTMLTAPSRDDEAPYRRISALWSSVIAAYPTSVGDGVKNPDMAMLSNSMSYSGALTNTTSTESPSTSGLHNDSEDDPVLSSLISKFLLIGNGGGNHGGSSSSSDTLVDWRAPSSLPSQMPFRHIPTTMAQNKDYSGATLQSFALDSDNSLSNSPGTSSTVSLTCFKCENCTPSRRCLECNELFCQGCASSLTSECHLRDHRIIPLGQISPIGTFHEARILGDLQCHVHHETIKFFCERCVAVICEQCVIGRHAMHPYAPLWESLDKCRNSLVKSLESSKAGTKSIKACIDKAVRIYKLVDRDSSEIKDKIKKIMKEFTKVLEDREKCLLEKVEKMRQNRLAELNEQMNSLRVVLSGVSETTDTLVTYLDSNGVELLVAREQTSTRLDTYADMFQKLQPKEDTLAFVLPNLDLIDQLRRMCDVVTSPFGGPLNVPFNYNGSGSNAVTTLSGARPLRSRCQNYLDSAPYYGVNQQALPVERFPPRGVGQCVPGYWLPVTAKPNRSPLPGIPMISFAPEGHEDGQVSRPWGLCVDREGNIIVADRRNNRIQIFDSDGNFKSKFGSKGTGPGEFDLPAGITTDVFGRVIVIDKDNHRVQVFSAHGGFLLKFGSHGKDCGQFQYPWDVAVNTLGEIAVTDTRNHRIQLFTMDGTFIAKFVLEVANPSRNLKGPTMPRGICFTPTGNLIVSDFENHRLLMIDSGLSRVMYMTGREGAGVMDFNRPSGMVCDDEGRIVIADSKNHRVLIFSPEMQYLWSENLRGPSMDDRDRPCDVALTPEGYLVVLFETLPDSRDNASHGKRYIKVY